MKSTIMWKLFPVYCNGFLPYVLPSVIRVRDLEEGGEKKKAKTYEWVELCAMFPFLKEEVNMFVNILKVNKTVECQTLAIGR